MNTVLLIFFAFPVATIILSAIFETFVNCPLKIAGIVFAIFLIITYAFFGSEFLVAAIIYTILAYITAWIVKRFEERSNSLQTIEELITNNNENAVTTNNNSCGCNNRYRRF